MVVCTLCARKEGSSGAIGGIAGAEEEEEDLDGRERRVKVFMEERGRMVSCGVELVVVVVVVEVEEDEVEGGQVGVRVRRFRVGEQA